MIKKSIQKFLLLSRILTGALTLMFVLSACTEALPEKFGEVSSSTAQTPIDSKKKKQNLRLITPASGLSMGTGNEQGHYSLSAREDGSMNIMYIDYLTKTQMILCSRPECTHRDESCPGWLPSGNGGAYTVLTGNTLCFIFGGQNTTAGYEGSTLVPKIITSQLNGADKKTIFTLSSEKGLTTPIAGDDSYLYLLCVSFSFTKHEVIAIPEMLKISVKDGKAESVHEWGQNDAVSIVGVWNEFVVVSASHRNGSGKSTTELQGVSTVDKSVRRYTSWDSSNSTEAKNGGYLVGEWYCYLNQQKEAITAYSLQTQQERELASVPNVEAYNFNFRTDIDGHLLYDIFSPSETPKDGKTTRYSITLNSDTPTVNEIPLYDTSEGIQSPWQIIAQTDEKLLVKTASITALVNAYDKDETPIQIETMAPQYSLITKQDYLSGKNVAEAVINSQ